MAVPRTFSDCYIYPRQCTLMSWLGGSKMVYYIIYIIIIIILSFGEITKLCLMPLAVSPLTTQIRTLSPLALQPLTD